MSSRRRYTRNLGRKLAERLPGSVEWVRFEHATEPYGVFCYLREAAPVLPGRSAAELKRLQGWFNKHLDAPSDRIEIGEARFWFRAEAMEYVGRGRRMAELVSRAGLPIVEKRTRELPGRVRWEDGAAAGGDDSGAGRVS